MLELAHNPHLSADILRLKIEGTVAGWCKYEVSVGAIPMSDSLLILLNTPMIVNPIVL